MRVRVSTSPATTATRHIHYPCALMFRQSSPHDLLPTGQAQRVHLRLAHLTGLLVHWGWPNAFFSCAPLLLRFASCMAALLLPARLALTQGALPAYRPFSMPHSQLLLLSISDRLHHLSLTGGSSHGRTKFFVLWIFGMHAH